MNILKNQKPEFQIKQVLYTSKTYANGENPIYIRITRQRKVIYISSGYTAKPNQWNKETSKLFTTKPRGVKGVEVNPNYGEINKAITKLLGKVEEALELPEIKRLTLKEIAKVLGSKERILDENKGAIGSFGSFIVYAEAQVSLKLKNEDIRTYKRYNTVINKLKVYLTDRGQKLNFEDFGTNFLEDYQAYLKTQLKNDVNTIYTNMKTLRAILYKAIAEKKFNQGDNPFFIFKLVENKKTKKEKLTFEEIVKLKKLKLEKSSPLDNARNSFLFCFFHSGVRIGDLLQLKWSNIKGGRLEYTMDKQGGKKSIKLRPEGLEIMKQYKGKSNFIFPYLNNDCEKMDALKLKALISSKTTLINSNLKKLAEIAKIEKNITTHIARHSFANLAKKRKLSPFEIQEALGHATVKQTETYLNQLDDEALDKSMDKVYKGL